MRRWIGAAAISVASAAAGGAQDVALDSQPARWRATLERVDAPGDDLGLFGLHFDVLSPFDGVPEIYAGGGGFVAVSGENGGFFAAGPTVGWLEELHPGWILDLGVFAGGGGGGGADVGAGFLVRPHVALEVALGITALRLELARVDFPDGDLDGTHLAIGATLPTEVLTARRAPRRRRIPANALLERPLRLGVGAVRLEMDSGVEKTDGSDQENVTLAGFELDYFVSRALFLPVQVYGAGSGDSAGFSAILGGIGASIPLGQDRVRAEASAKIGGGGGGDVDTGGGFLWEAEAGLSAQVTRDLALRAGVGRLDAPDGDLEATSVRAGLLWTPSVVELALDYPRSRLADEGLPSHEVKIEGLRLVALHKSLFPRSGAEEGGGKDLDNVHMVGAGLEKDVGDGVFLTARALTAYGGDAGGFAEGLGGIGWETRPVRDRPEHVLGLRFEAGVAGGSGVDVGSGRIFGGAVRYRYRFSDRLGFEAEYGYEEADTGSYAVDALTVGIHWNLQRAVPR